MVFDPDDKRNDPRAGDPDYIYLLLDKEAVRLTGPSLAGQSEDLFEFRSPSVEMRIETVPEGHQHAIGMDVVVNERLTYQFTIDDFEDEGSLIGSASLTLLNGTMESEFVFAALGSPGVAHDLTIQAIIDGVPTGAATAPVTIETRYDDDDGGACIIGSDWVDEILEPLRACSPEDVCLVLSAPGNCWHGTVNEAKQGNTETIEEEILCGENCEVPLPVGAECYEGTCRLVH